MKARRVIHNLVDRQEVVAIKLVTLAVDLQVLADQTDQLHPHFQRQAIQEDPVHLGTLLVDRSNLSQRRVDRFQSREVFLVIRLDLRQSLVLVASNMDLMGVIDTNIV